MIKLAPTKSSPAYWEKRIFHNSYTRAGKLCEVNSWSVKIQHAGSRRTFTLPASSREDAALLARDIYRLIVEVGWEQAERERSSWKEHDLRQMEKWRDRLIFRRYIDWASPGAEKEYSARIEHGGAFHFFPLGTAQEEQAARKAIEIYQTVAERSWSAAFARYSREITLAIYWSHTPVACTYATLLSHINHASLSEQPRHTPTHQVLLVEPDKSTRLTLQHCINRQPHFECASAYSCPEEALASLIRSVPSLILVNRDLPGASSVEWRQKAQTLCPQAPVFPFGIFEESDKIFASISGVEAGYIFRRAKPDQLFAPIQPNAQKETLAPGALFASVRHFFQNLFPEIPPEESQRFPNLTYREKEILKYLSKGFLDKEIAHNLNVSAWTVHNHVKKIYLKLQAHNRTEAVVKFLHS